MKPQKCTLVVNNSWGYTYTPIQCNSISSAKQQGYNYFGGFYFHIVVNKKIVYRGYCKKY